MRIVVITSCTGEKVVEHENQLTLADFQKGPEHVQARERDLKQLMRPAEALYSGQQHVRLMRGVQAYRDKCSEKGTGSTLDLHVLSAGYGLVPGDRELAPYEATFTGMKAKELRSWAATLEIPATIRSTLAQPFDLALILLGEAYLKACDLDETIVLGGPAVVFCSSKMAAKLPRLAGMTVVPLSTADTKRFSCGLIGLKGELAHRLLRQIVDDVSLIEKLADFDLASLLSDQDAKSQAIPVPKPRSVANPEVDNVIALPKDWDERARRRKLRYFIPDWDDLVDPDYDFENDVHSGGSGNWSNEVYAHQMYPEPNYDGLLISKVVAEKSKSKAARINELGVHRFLRVPRSFPVMGDCGAFGYINEDVPPYSTPEILDYYTRLDFDYGVSIDHLIVKSTLAQQEERYQLTIHNADEFLKEHQQRDLSWTPIGAVQGWDPKSYAEAARQYVAMGYTYIALGGLVRTSTKEIISVLDAVHKVVPAHVDVHLFGLARVDSMQRFSDLGVTSVDSASLLRRAWMGTGQNYLTMEGVFYTALRVPEADRSYRAKRMVEDGRASAAKVARLDRACMQALRDFDVGGASVQSVLDVLGEYDQMITPDRADTTELLRHTLEDKPWKQCGCSICKKDGIQVIIFRGNNRNRRRGFHNTYVFYRLLEQALSGAPVSLRRIEKVSLQQGLPDLLEEVGHAL
jgi:queuine tRNA-ribosyltransferase-like protein